MRHWPVVIASLHLLFCFTCLIWSNAVAAQTAPDQNLVLTDAERHWISEHPVIRLGADPDYPPFEFFDNRGLYGGIASDYLKIIEAQTGLKILTPVNQPWPETMLQARAKQVDLLAAVGKSEERESFLVFSEPFQNYRRVILMHEDAPPINGIQDLTGQRVGALRESTDPDFLAINAPGVEVVLFDSYDEALLALSQESVDAIVGNGMSAVFTSRQLGLIDVNIAAPASFTQYSLHFAARNDWPELISIINKVLATIPLAERNEIQRKWSLVSATGMPDYSLIWKTALALLPFLLFAFAWAYHAKVQQRRLERVQAQLKTATQKSDSANKAKSTFLANMSHEMRTPLTGIIGFLGLILEEKPGNVIREHAELSMDSAKNLLQLINDILDLARLESGVTVANPGPICLDALLRSVVSAMRPLATEKGLALEFSQEGMGPSLVKQDDKLLRQILVNLVGNAIKFTREGKVSVTLTYLKSDRPGLCCYRIDVIDTGVGIEGEDLARLTKRFEQVHSLAVNNSSGTGLGLAICDELVRLLGGSFSFESEFGTGSTFSVKLYSPYVADKPDDDVVSGNKVSQDAGSAGDSIEGARIYLADDNAIIRTLVEKMLAPHGVEVSSFSDGQALFEAMQKEAYDNQQPGCDLILMDIHMPEMDGLEAQRQIRKLGPAFDHLPIIALTANAIKGEREIYLSEGMDGYVSKPIDPEHFLRTLRHFLQIHAFTPGNHCTTPQSC
ncbi:ATP-binding protein [Kordiimonas lacus]|nr:transporter substrate-binding domain-containing protein [Kordiimonas lacus]